jgi:hypothetical protein
MKQIQLRYRRGNTHAERTEIQRRAQHGQCDGA